MTSLIAMIQRVFVYSTCIIILVGASTIALIRFTFLLGIIFIFVRNHAGKLVTDPINSSLVPKKGGLTFSLVICSEFFPIHE